MLRCYDSAVSPSISVVIPTRNRAVILRETLEALFSAAPQHGTTLEVLVVEDGDGEALDVALACLDRPLRVLRSGGRGAAAARNLGAAAARHELLVFLDDDIILTPGSLQRHLDTHGRFPRALVSGVARPDGHVLQEAERTASLGDGVFPVAKVASFNLSVPRQDFAAIEGFDERFPFAWSEDQEFCFRASARGLEMLVDEGIPCLHKEADRLRSEAWLRRQLLSRKALVATLAARPSRVFLLRALQVLERWGVPDPIVFKGYHLLWAIHTHSGVREGLRRLAPVQAPGA